MQQGTKNDQSDIEPEDLGITKITHPYDPDKIKVDQQNVNLGYLIEMLENDEIDLMPEFQRSMDLWNNEQKSRLIESLLLGLPLPSFYFSADEKTNKWLVVDGLQRLCTFKDFIINNNLKLEGLEFLETFEKKTYSDLTREEKRKINGAKINLHVIEKQTPSYVKFLIFKRVNTGGLVLTPQEMRHALNQGIPAEFIKELASTKEFIEATCGSINTTRMEDRDFVNRFVAFYLLGYEENYDGELDNFLNKGMEELNTLSDDERKNVKTAFVRAMRLAKEFFGNDAFRKRYNVSDSRKPISKAVFDTVSVNLAWLSDSEMEDLRGEKEELVNRMLLLFKEKDFNNAITTGTGQKTSVKTRFGAVKLLFKGLVW